MSLSSLHRPGVALGTYPERAPDSTSKLPEAICALLALSKVASPGQRRRGRKLVRAVFAECALLSELTLDELRAHCQRLRTELSDPSSAEEWAPRAFAAIREVCARKLGKAHHPSQLLGGWAMLHGYIAEMQTGEGKTLAALLPACTAALAGVPVHVFTANDYLAERDCAQLRPIYEFFGLSVAVLTDHITDRGARREAYACEVLYCAPQQAAFDYLRDRVAMGTHRSDLERKVASFLADDLTTSPDGEPVPDQAYRMRGLCFAIVDEADSVLIDDACTPLVLSANGEAHVPIDQLEWALSVAASMRANEHFELSLHRRKASLTTTGKTSVLRALPPSYLLSVAQSEQLVAKALQALHCYVKDRDYVVRDGRVELVNANTGRAQTTHAWDGGIQQLVETKESVPPSAHRRTVARISYQRFFGRYLHLCGASGTVREVAAELRSVYDLRVFPIPTHAKTSRAYDGRVVFTGMQAKWDAVARRSRKMQRAGRPVLIGTSSVAESEELSRSLRRAGVAHALLSAKQDKDEAETISAAGQAGVVTVATNMAGRGTDIELSDEVRRLGGLHVIIAAANRSRRVDRQIAGRCARQGDEGSWELMLSLDEVLLETYMPDGVGWLLRHFHHFGFANSGLLATRLAQFLCERHGRRIRRNILRFDQQNDERLAFAGPSE